MEECLVPAHRNQHFQRLGAPTEMPKMRKVELNLPQLRVVEAPGGAAEGEPGSLHPLQNRVELGVADMERVMMDLERPHLVVEVECQSLVHAHWREATA